MNQKFFSTIYLVLGLAFGIMSIVFAFLPTNTFEVSSILDKGNLEVPTKDTTKKFDNADFGTLGTAIISAACFVVAGNLIKSSKS